MTQPRVVILVAALCAATTAWAEPSPTDIAVAKKLFADATADEDGERWADALAKLKRVVATKETPGIRFHIALCEERLGTLIAARASYERASRIAEKATGAEAKQIITDAAAAMVRIDGRLPTVTITLGGSAPATTIKVDGELLDPARLGSAFRHDPGEVRVEATAPGKRAFEKRVVLVDRASAVIDIVLDEEAARPPATSSAPASSGAANGSPPRAEGASDQHGVPSTAWITGGAALASAGVALYWFLHRSALVSDTDTTCADPYVRCDRQARDAKASTYLGSAIAGASVAVVLGGITTYLVVRPTSAQTSAGFPGGHLTLGGRF